MATSFWFKRKEKTKVWDPGGFGAPVLCSVFVFLLGGCAALGKHALPQRVRTHTPPHPNHHSHLSPFPPRARSLSSWQLHFGLKEKKRLKFGTPVVLARLFCVLFWSSCWEAAWRWLKAPVRNGVGSSPTDVNFILAPKTRNVRGRQWEREWARSLWPSG